MERRSLGWSLGTGLVLGMLMTTAAGCAPAEEEDQGTSEDMVKSDREKEKERSRWRPGWGTIFGVPTIAQLNAADRSPAWNDGKDCAKGLLPGTLSLGKRLKKEFPNGVSGLGGFNCRKIAHNGRMSMHGTGRALDVHTTKAKGGDDIADYLVQHSATLGVERVIWRNTEWFAIAVGSWSWSYVGGGRDDHTDHIHVELTPRAAADRSVCATLAECAVDLVAGDSDGE